MTEAVAIKDFKHKNFKLDCGVTLPELVVAYQTFAPRETKDGQLKPTVLVSTCFGEIVSSSS